MKWKIYDWNWDIHGEKKAFFNFFKDKKCTAIEWAFFFFFFQESKANLSWMKKNTTLAYDMAKPLDDLSLCIISTFHLRQIYCVKNVLGNSTNVAVSILNWIEFWRDRKRNIWLKLSIWKLIDVNFLCCRSCF